jgi:hypothetical protein
MTGVSTVTHLAIHTADHGTIDVHLGPSSWVAAQRVTFQVGDDIEVIGSRVKYGGADVVVARQIRKGRPDVDASGYPGGLSVVAGR